MRTDRQTNLLLYIYEPFGLGRFATDRCYAPQVNGRYAALLPTNFYFSRTSHVVH